ncbi:LysR family transcriptional regulator [Tardiphaga sp. vice352]|uniref:LysR substrate-binding domain-containing protein n=1 Tax=unclassified Tardiphaga TaxID=2631404 RepID=UPI0011646790|nr:MULTISPECIES: LysR substrate-binding domain-containing protein [unclassified Tardiphaga]QDM17661.1 LysR family transcriptional regulator [Tardiphaga sp. vice278]QDM22599.1 LysR family transcriptional regulator [Tardiphaga sp. vice154]QDM27901.1 LysR family transcriptional regulator [Tardiphaga sp. vice304]QDM33044.1 LysR family transcriptional regulator [Tardiphaga sp. vice352]
MLPPLNPLHVFDVAARLLSFTRAAAELRVTQPAISRQINTLESFLGVRLFERDRQGLRLTSEGEQFQRQIAPAFAIIANATAGLMTTGRAEPLKIRVYTTFAAKWLIQRLPSFYVAYPHIKLNISNVVAPIDFEKDKVDLAIQFGAGHWPNVECELLFKDLIQPMCSPKLLKSHRMVEPDDLRRVQLLHSHYRRADWPDWLMAVNRPDLLTDAGISFPSSVLTYHAAVEGVGVAMGQLYLLRNEINDGSLIPLFNAPFERQLAHYVAWPKHRPLGRKARSFMHWLRLQTGEFLKK